MVPSPGFSRLYAILDTDVLAARRLPPLEVCDIWLSGGIRLIQLRAKQMASGPMLALADALLARTRAAGAQLIINDRADIAALCGADGVHIGQDDLSPADVRHVLGHHAMVGLSTHGLAQVAQAIAARPSYIAVGPVFGTRTKDTGYAPLGLDVVRLVADQVHAEGLPLVAIGGIDVSRAPDVLQAGADAVAVITDLVGHTMAGTVDRVQAWRDQLVAL